MPDKLTLEQFGQRIKAQHPEYADMLDSDLGAKVLAKYPEYSDMVQTGAGGVPHLGGVDTIKALAMQASHNSGKPVPIVGPKAPKAPTVPYSDPVNSALINVAAKTAQLPESLITGSIPGQSISRMKEGYNDLQSAFNGVPLSEIQRQYRERHPVGREMAGLLGIDTQEVANDASSGNYGALVGDTAFPIALTLLGGKLARESKVEPKDLQTRGQYIREQVVPKQVERLTAALNPQPTSGIPDALRRALPAMNEVVKDTGAKVGSVSDFVENVAKPTSTKLETKYQSWIDPIRDKVVDAQPIKDAVIKQIKSHRPDAVNESIAAWADENIKPSYTVSELDQLRKDLGSKNSSFFSKGTIDKMTDARSAGVDKVASRAALNAVKDVLYSEIENANPGQDVRGLKLTQSALQKIIKQGENRTQFLDTIQQKVAGRPNTRLVLQAAKDAGNVRFGNAAMKLHDAMSKKSFIVSDANKAASKSFRQR